MIKTIIIDDESHAIETLQWMLQEYCPEASVVEVCGSGKEGIEAISVHQPELVFLDIEMPHMNGFEMLEQLDEVRFHLIFTTAYDRYAIKAFKVSALDYLLKPIDRDELITAVNKLNVHSTRTNLNRKIRKLFDQLNIIKRITLPTMGGLKFIDLDTISHCDSDGSYAIIHLIGGKPIIVSKTLKKVEDLLPSPPFIRVHHSHLVNLNYVDRYVRGSGGYLVLNNGQHVNVSRTRKDVLLKLIQND